MLYRFTFAGLGLFCATMLGLLWRSEFAADQGGASVPLNLVWNKILTAPDNSSLELRRNGTKEGFCRWIPNVGEDLATGKIADEESQPEGMVTALSNYTLDIEGHITPVEVRARYRFHLHLELASNNEWKQFELQISEKKQTWDLKASQADQTVTLSFGDGTPGWRQSFRFDELKDPQKLLSGLDIPFLPLLLPGVMPSIPSSSNPLSLGLVWECKQDWLRLGHSRMRTYRLKAKIFDRFSVVVHVSRVGEILRAELPGQILLVNEAIAAF